MNNKTIKNVFPLKCHRCGNEEFFCQRMSYQGESELNVDNQGEYNHYNGEIYDNAKYKLKSVYYFCRMCHKKVAKIPIDKRY